MAYENEIAKAFDDLWLKSFRDTLIPARLGVITSATPTYDVAVTGRAGYVYVSLGVNGERGRAIARDAVGVDTTAEWQEIKMRREKGELVIREASTLSGGGGGGVSALDDLSDVAITSLADGHTLQYDSGTGDWVNVVPPGGAGGAPSPHALDSVHHTGTLPWADIDTSGSNLTDLTTRAHAALQGMTPNDHHNQVHVLATNAGLGADHTISGASVGHVLRATSATAAAIAELQHDDLGGVTPNQHHNQVHNIVGTDHTITGNTLDVVGAIGSNTLGLLVPSSDPGAATKLLKSDINGGLVLQQLQVEGNVDVTNGGQLYVGGGVGGASGIITTLGSTPETARVGFGRIPDPQFTVDVNGALRADYLVGKHAIQLSDVALIMHFDGHPGTDNYTGEPNGIPMGNVPTINHDVHYRPGKFEKAAVMGYGSVNLMDNGSFELGTAGWSNFNAGGGDLAFSQSLEAVYFGTYGAKVTWTTIDTSQFYNGPIVTATGSTHYNAGCWMRAAVPCTVRLRIRKHLTPFTIYREADFSVSEEWQWYAITTADGTMPAGGDTLRFSIDPQTSGANVLYVDGVLFSNGVEPTFYFDGSMPGVTWAGTAFASDSTRSEGRMAWSLKSMQTHRWTMMAWVKLPYTEANGTRGIMRMHDTSGANDVEIYANTTGIRADVTVAGVTNTLSFMDWPVDQAWHHLAITYTPGEVATYYDGALVSTVAKTFTNPMMTAYVGSIGGPIYGNQMIDEFVVSRLYMDAKEVRAIYESDAPVFAESSVFTFRATPLGLVWADEEGLWMREASGSAVFGIYGGVASSKSWGGVSLGIGDLLIGRSPQAYLHWDASAGQLFMHKADITLNDGVNSRGELTSVGNLTLGTDITTTSGISFQVISEGANAGDVIVGNPALSQYMQWDQSVGTLTIAGTLLVGGAPVDFDSLATEGYVDIAEADAKAYFDARRIVGVSGTWTSTDADTVTWSSVSIQRGDGAIIQVNDGNTGNMTTPGLKRYLHANLASVGGGGTISLSIVSAIASIPAGNTLVAIATPRTDGAEVQVMGGTTLISADGIVTPSLSAINVNTGALSVSGTLTIGNSSNGKIISQGKTYGGATAGIFLGWDSSAHKLDIGDSNAYLRWDGDSLTMKINDALDIVVPANDNVLSVNDGVFSAVIDYTAGEFISSANWQIPFITATKFDQTGDTFRIRQSRSIVGEFDAGFAGEICWDAGRLYVCVADNVWRRVSITWP